MGGSWDSSELRRRQAADEVGFIKAGSSQRRWTTLLMPLGVLLVGFVLAFVGPLPGLGVFLILGGALALPVMAITVWLGG